jgi:hypothetical protein
MAEATVGRDQEVTKKPGRNEPMWVAIHMCMEAIRGSYLCSYLYHQQTKLICLFYYLLCLLFNKMGEGGIGSAW